MCIWLQNCLQDLVQPPCNRIVDMTFNPLRYNDTYNAKKVCHICVLK